MTNQGTEGTLQVLTDYINYYTTASYYTLKQEARYNN